jgi:hypothetical protein
MVNGRITSEQMEWLKARAEELSGNLSAALRQTIMDARMLELMRKDYELLREDHPEFAIPPHDDDGTARVLRLGLTWPVADPEDLDLRRQEASGED